MTAARSADSQFTQVRRDALQDSRLSYTARGLLVFVLSLPGRSFTPGWLAGQMPDSLEDILDAIAELEMFGYCRDGIISDDPAAP